MTITTPQSKIARFVFTDTRLAWLWLILRVYMGWIWFMAGWDKFESSKWVGSEAGQAVQGFLQGALAKTAGAHPDVQWWYAGFIQGFALHHTVFFSYLVTFGEMLVGVGLIVGLFTPVAAFFGSVMNLNYLLSGTVSINPIFLVLQIFLILAWRTAGYYGLDRVRPTFRKVLTERRL